MPPVVWSAAGILCLLGGIVHGLGAEMMEVGAGGWGARVLVVGVGVWGSGVQLPCWRLAADCYCFCCLSQAADAALRKAERALEQERRGAETAEKAAAAAVKKLEK